MFVLFIVLNKVEFLEDILTEFVKIGIRGATILDSQGMASALVSNKSQIPILGTLRAIVDNFHPYNKTIFTILENDEIVQKTMKLVNDVVGDMDSPGTGVMFTMPIGNIYGLSSYIKNER